MQPQDFIEVKVQNKRNATDIEKISIYGLFGRYNIEIPFEKSVNIFIGENGLGKTTILNCIYFILEKKFTRLANIKFSHIDIKIKNNNPIRITLEDIIVYNEENRRHSMMDFDIKRTIEGFILSNDHLDFSYDNI